MYKKLTTRCNELVYSAIAKNNSVINRLLCLSRGLLPWGDCPELQIEWTRVVCGGMDRELCGWYTSWWRSLSAFCLRCYTVSTHSTTRVTRPFVLPPTDVTTLPALRANTRR